MKLVRFHHEAEQELAEHEAWYRQRSEVAAQGFLLELDHAIAAVAEAPERWPTGRRGERRYVFPRYPFTLLYRVRGDEVFSVDLLDGRTITVPLVWFPRLLRATPQQRRVWEIAGAGYGIHWPEIDEDISVQGLLVSAPAPRVKVAIESNPSGAAVSRTLSILSNREHLDAIGQVFEHDVIQKAVRRGVPGAGVKGPVGCHTLRHCFATHLLEDGYGIRTIQEFLWSPRREDDDDLHARFEQRRRTGRAQLAGESVTGKSALAPPRYQDFENPANHPLECTLKDFIRQLLPESDVA